MPFHTDFVHRVKNVLRRRKDKVQEIYFPSGRRESRRSEAAFKRGRRFSTIPSPRQAKVIGKPRAASAPRRITTQVPGQRQRVKTMTIKEMMSDTRGGVAAGRILPTRRRREAFIRVRR